MPPTPKPLAETLREEITQRGPMSFRDFMARALYDPMQGYYGAGRARVGRGGDFFTNVSVGPLFGRLLARQFADMWRRLGEPGDFVLVEQGAHHGEAAADVLTALGDFDPLCFAATTLWLIEPLDTLRHAQKQTLQRFAPDKVRWTETPAGLPEFRGVHYSNELLDAFPVHRVVWRGDHWKERRVDLQDGQFVFIDAEVTEEVLRAHLARLPAVPPDYETEVNLEVVPWVREIGARLREGFILVIDYGYPRAEYYRPERTIGTLSAYSAHRREPNPLARPGEIDLTAHVDFTSVGEAAGIAGLEIAGFTDQHHFMVDLGRLHFPEVLPAGAATEKELRAFKTLMHPGLLGRSFHALCLAKGVEHHSLPGFAFATAPERMLFGR